MATTRAGPIWPLVGYLCHQTADDQQVDRVFRRSGLMRSKWDEKRGALSYGRRTIEAARKGSAESEKPQLAASSPELDVVNWDAVSGEITWLWKGKIPLESITLLAGIGGLGKSTVSLDLAASISKGGKLPDGQMTAQGTTLVFSAEDPDKVVRNRLLKQGADLRFVKKINGTKVGGRTRYFDIADLATLELAMQKYPDTKLIIIDPIASYVSGIDAHKNADVRRVMAPLAAFAEKHRLAVILIVHLNKDSQKASHSRISGSTAWRDPHLYTHLGTMALARLAILLS